MIEELQVSSVQMAVEAALQLPAAIRWIGVGKMDNRPIELSIFDHGEKLSESFEAWRLRSIELHSTDILMRPRIVYDVVPDCGWELNPESFLVDTARVDRRNSWKPPTLAVELINLPIEEEL
ncbi:MAG: hypothetical protein ACRCT2_01710 [Plesiomonas shigelloides]